MTLIVNRNSNIDSKLAKKLENIAKKTNQLSKSWKEGVYETDLGFFDPETNTVYPSLDKEDIDEMEPDYDDYDDYDERD